MSAVVLQFTMPVLLSSSGKSKARFPKLQWCKMTINWHASYTDTITDVIYFYTTVGLTVRHQPNLDFCRRILWKNLYVTCSNLFRWMVSMAGGLNIVVCFEPRVSRGFVWPTAVVALLLLIQQHIRHLASEARTPGRRLSNFHCAVKIFCNFTSFQAATSRNDR